MTKSLEVLCTIFVHQDILLSFIRNRGIHDDLLSQPCMWFCVQFEKSLPNWWNQHVKESIYKDTPFDFLQKEAQLHLKFRNCVFIPLALLHAQQLTVMTKNPTTTLLSCLTVQMGLSSTSPLYRQIFHWLLCSLPGTEKTLRWRSQQKWHCKWYHSSFLQGAEWEYNDYTEEHLRETRWSSLREMKTESIIAHGTKGTNTVNYL